MKPNKKIFFYIDENNNLRVGNFFIKFTYLKHIDSVLMNICNNSSNNIKVTLENFDFKTPSKFGSFARIYHPDIKSCDNEKITRVTTCEQMFEYNDLEKQSLSPFCIFPIEHESSGEFIVQTFKKCINSDFFDEFFREYSLSDKLKKFRSLFVALKSFTKSNFFHADIKITNIVLDNDEFKFIDLDLACFIDKPEPGIEILEDVLVYTFPTFLNIDMIYYMLKDKNDVYFEINEHSNQSIVKYITYLKSLNLNSDIPKLICSNLTPLPYNVADYYHLHFKKTQKEKLNVFHYVSIYQLTISLYEFINFTCVNKYLDIIEDFISDILNFQINGLQSIDNVLDKYDTMIIKIENEEGSQKENEEGSQKENEEGSQKENKEESQKENEEESKNTSETSGQNLGKRLRTLEYDFQLSDDSLSLSSDTQSVISCDSSEIFQFKIDDF